MSYIGNTPTQVAFVTDSFSGNGSTTAFTMSVAPANTASVLVAVSGVLQDPSTYSVVGTTLTFTGAPPSGTGNISVRYLGIPASGVTTTAYRTVTEFTATAGQTTFTPPSYTAGFINVYQNGVRLGSADYTATNGTTVILTASAAANDLVTVESYYVSSVLNAIPATAGSVNSTYIAAGAALANIGAGGLTQSYLGAGVANTGPAFAATGTSTQTFGSGVWTKIAFQTETYDTNSCYDNATNYRFTPTVAGYYQMNLAISANETGAGGVVVYTAFYKNGAAFTSVMNRDDNGQPRNLSQSCLIYCNGTTDYIEAYGYISGGTFGTGSSRYFSGSLARAA